MVKRAAAGASLALMCMAPTAALAAETPVADPGVDVAPSLAPAAAPVDPWATLGQTAITAGESITVDGQCMGVTDVYIWVSELATHATVASMDIEMTDANGLYSAQLPIPADAAAGTYKVHVMCAWDDAVMPFEPSNMEFEVTAREVTPTPWESILPPEAPTSTPPDETPTASAAPASNASEPSNLAATGVESLAVPMGLVALTAGAAGIALYRRERAI